MSCNPCNEPREGTDIAPVPQFAGPVAPVNPPVNPPVNSPVDPHTPLTAPTNVPTPPMRALVPLTTCAPSPMLPEAPFCNRGMLPEPAAVGCSLPAAPSQSCLNPKAKKSCATKETLLPAYLQSSFGVTSMVLMGRVGSMFAHLLGTGYLRIKDGVVSVIENLEISTRFLWPDAIATAPTPLNPQPFPYQLVADETGCSYLLKGKAGASVISVWNPATSMWELTPLNELKKCNKGRLEKSNKLQLVGYEPYGLTDEKVEKCQKAFCGEGFVFISKQDTNPTDPGCVCVECQNDDRDKECFASTIPLPPRDGKLYAMKWDTLTSSFLWVAAKAE